VTHKNQYAGCYALDLYCDRENDAHGWSEFPHQFTGETFGECAREARLKGWTINRKTRFATCPKCNRPSAKID
jgi:hypothetical protein